MPATARAGKRARRSFSTLDEIQEEPAAAVVGVCLEMSQVAVVLHAMLPASQQGEKAETAAALRAYLETFLNSTLPEMTAKFWEAANFHPHMKVVIRPRGKTQ